MTASHPRTSHLFFAIFAISGFSGLIYEAIWSHYLKLFLGHAAYAQTLVLVIFMGGMAIGSWGMARFSVRVANLLLGYALVEGIIGLLGLLFHRVSLGTTAWLFEAVLPNVDSTAAAHLVKWTVGALLILPQSVLLGMTFPLMSGAMVRRFPERSGETLAMLYFTNSLGAAAGVLVSGFVLIGLVGLPGTIMTAGLLNVLLALFVWGVAKFQPETVVHRFVADRTTAHPVSQGIARWLIVGAALTGVASFFYEIAWIRMLSLVLGSSTHSFELMLSAFILGIAVGGLWVRRRIDSLRNPVRFLSIILAIMAGVALLSLPVYGFTFDLMSQVILAFSATDQGYIGVNLSSHAIAMLVMIPTTFFCGTTLPVMTHVLVRSGSGERAIGTVYAWNTAGAIAGVIIAVHVLMPAVGLKGIVLAGTTLQLLLSLVYWHMTSERATSVGHTAGRAVACVAALAIAATVIDLDPAKLASGVYRTGSARLDDSREVLFLKHGKTASISLVHVDGLTSIATNGKPDAAIAMDGNDPSEDEITMVLLGALPSALHPSPHRVAAIGFGSGLTSEVLLTDPRVEQVDTIEIEPLMPKAARLGFSPRVRRTFDDPRSRIHFEDAKTFFAVHRSTYDLIVSEPSNPWVSGVASLFSTEFYEQITRHLSPGGMLVQWLQIYETDLDIVLSVVKALAPHFADFAIYNTDATNLVIIAVRDGTIPELHARMLEWPDMRAELGRVGIHSIGDLRSRYLGNKGLLLPLVRVAGVPANSDYFPYVDLHATKARILRRNAAELTGLQTLPVPLFELINGIADSRETTVPSPNAPTPRDELTRHAAAIRDAVRLADASTLDDVTRLHWLALTSSAKECEKKYVQAAWLDAAYHIGSSTNTALSAAELKPMWDSIATLPCEQALQGHDRDFLELLRAVAARDISKINSLGNRLLAAEYEFAEPRQLLFTLLATAATSLAMDRPKATLGAIAKWGSRISKPPAVALALRWLAAIAADRTQMSSPASTHRDSQQELPIQHAALTNIVNK